MEKRSRLKTEKIRNNKTAVLFGILLIFPVYILIFAVMGLLKLNTGDNYILMPLLMYLPMSAGLIVSSCLYKKRIFKVLLIVIAVLFLLTLYFYYMTYLVEHHGWEAMDYFFFWLGATVLLRILCCVFYGRLFGVKRTLIFAALYILTAISSILLGFWT